MNLPLPTLNNLKCKKINLHSLISFTYSNVYRQIHLVQCGISSKQFFLVNLIIDKVTLNVLETDKFSSRSIWVRCNIPYPLILDKKRVNLKSKWFKILKSYISFIQKCIYGKDLIPLSQRKSLSRWNRSSVILELMTRNYLPNGSLNVLAFSISFNIRHSNTFHSANEDWHHPSYF